MREDRSLGPRVRCVQREDRSRLGRGIMHVTGGLSRRRVGVLKAPPACDYRSALATPDGVWCLLFVLIRQEHVRASLGHSFF